MEKISPRFKLPPASIQWRDDAQDFYFAGQLDEYRVMNKLGQGQYGVVKLGVRVNTGERVALKIINKADLTETERASLKREAEVMSFLNHRSIIRTVCVIENRINLCLVMEFAAGGELFDHIIRQNKLKEVEARNLFVQMLEGIGYCHSRGIIHRDIKAENIFLDEKLEIVKIGDFGFSSVIGDDREEEACGSLDYAAPEILGARSRPGPEGDVWALGVVLYFMIMGTLPFKAATDFDVYQKIRKADYRPLPSSTAPDLVVVIKMLFEPNPLNRPTVATVLQQTWCQQAIKDPEYLKHPKMSRMLQLQIKQNFQGRVKTMSKSDAAAHGETTGALSPRSLIASVSAPNLNVQSTAASSGPTSSSTRPNDSVSSQPSMTLSSKVAAAKLARARSSQKAAAPPASATNPIIHEDKSLSPAKRSSVKSNPRDSKPKKPKPKPSESLNELKAPESKESKSKSQRGSRKRRPKHEILEEDEEGVAAVDPQDSPRRQSLPTEQALPPPIESLIPQLIPIPKGGDKTPQSLPGVLFRAPSIPSIHTPAKDISDESQSDHEAQPMSLPALNLNSNRIKLTTSSPRSGRKPATPLPSSSREPRKGSSSRSNSQKSSPTTSPATSPRTKKALKDGQHSPPRKGSYAPRTSRNSVRMSDFSVVKVSQEQLDTLIANKDVEVLSVEREGDTNVVVLSAPAARNRINTVRDVLLDQFEKNATKLKRSKSTENVSLASSIFGALSEFSKSQGHHLPHNRKSPSPMVAHAPRDVDSPARPRVSPQERPELSNFKRPLLKKTRSNSYNHEMFRDLLAKKRDEIPDDFPRRSDSLRRKFDSLELPSGAHKPSEETSPLGKDTKETSS